MSNTTAPTPNDDHFGNREEMIARYKEAIAHWQADKEALDYQMAALKAQLAECEQDARGKVYQMCVKHQNSAWPMFSVTYSAPPIQVCPICDAAIDALPDATNEGTRFWNDVDAALNAEDKK